MVFRGIHSVSLNKGRVLMPSRYRDLFSPDQSHSAILTIDTESPCLLLYPFAEWQKIEEKLTQLPSFNPMARRIQRLLLGHATECDFDAHNRLLIPLVLRDYAQLEKEVVLLGQGQKIEVWSAELWQDARKDLLKQNLLGNGEMPDELKGMIL